MAEWMIYGANGYTGRLITAMAQARGHAPIVAGRHPQRVLELSRATGLPSRIFDLKEPLLVARQLEGVAAVVHCAGPFSATARPMLDACLKARVHYLDITGEIDVFEMIHGRDQELRQAGVAAIPGVGFDVVPTDCLAAMLHARLPDAESLALAFIVRGGSTSPGTAKTTVEALAKGGRIRQAGLLKTVPAGYKTRQIPFPGGAAMAVSIPWGDVSTAFFSTGIPNIEVYLGMSKGAAAVTKTMGHVRWLVALPPVTNFLKRRIERHVAGPSVERRARSVTSLWGEARNSRGQAVSLRLQTPDGYTLTADSAVRAVEHLLAGPARVGALTPSRAFGADFVKELEGVELLP